MKIILNYSKRSGTVKNAFNKVFPYLKIEFFNKAHGSGEASAAKNLITENVLLEKINPLIREGYLSVSPKQTVAELEDVFKNRFGLPVQVFRKHKEVWIETTKTDQLTLAEQNEKGKEASKAPDPLVLGDRYLEDGQY